MAIAAAAATARPIHGLRSSASWNVLGAAGGRALGASTAWAIGSGCKSDRCSMRLACTAGGGDGGGGGSGGADAIWTGIGTDAGVGGGGGGAMTRAGIGVGGPASIGCGVAFGGRADAGFGFDTGNTGSGGSSNSSSAGAPNSRGRSARGAGSLRGRPDAIVGPVHSARRARTQLANACPAATTFGDATPKTIIASDPVSDLRTYLSDTAQRELQTLRASLEARLLALEAALAHPEPHDTLEDLVMDLARVASAEVETAAAHKWLEAQLQVQERAERDAFATVRAEMDRLKADLDVAREHGNHLRRDAEAAQAALHEERVGAARLDADLGTARTAASELRETIEALHRDL